MWGGRSDPLHPNSGPRSSRPIWIPVVYTSLRPPTEAWSPPPFTPASNSNRKARPVTPAAVHNRANGPIFGVRSARSGQRPVTKDTPTDGDANVSVCPRCYAGRPSIGAGRRDRWAPTSTLYTNVLEGQSELGVGGLAIGRDGGGRRPRPGSTTPSG